MRSSWHARLMTMNELAAPILDKDAWQVLRESHATYASEVSPHYDEVLQEVSSRIRITASIGKTDIGALLFWKRLRANTPWVSKLMVMPDKDVRAVTEKAVSAVNSLDMTTPMAASVGRGALSPLPGFKSGDALASALLLAAAPERMAVYDRRAMAALKKLGLSLSTASGRYGRYMALVEDLRAVANSHGHTWTARDVDIALYWLGGATAPVPT